LTLPTLLPAGVAHRIVPEEQAREERLRRRAENIEDGERAADRVGTADRSTAAIACIFFNWRLNSFFAAPRPAGHGNIASLSRTFPPEESPPSRVTRGAVPADEKVGSGGPSAAAADGLPHPWRRGAILE